MSDTPNKNLGRTLFERRGFRRAPLPFRADILDALFEARNKLYRDAKLRSYNYLCGVHNPYGIAAGLVDSWKLLSICQSEDLLALVKPIYGNDLLLCESSFIDLGARCRHNGWWRHSTVIPIDPPKGMIIRICLDSIIKLEYLVADPKFDYDDQNHLVKRTISLKPGQAVCESMDVLHRYAGSQPLPAENAYLVYYSPASAQFLRQWDHPTQLRLTVDLPLINYSQSPIWLVSGTNSGQNDLATGFRRPVARWIGENGNHA